MNKPVYTGRSILELSKILMREFWYDYVKLKYGEKAKLFYQDTVSLYTWKQRIFIKTLQKMLKPDSILQIRPLPKGKNKKVIGLLRDKLGRKTMTKFVGLRTKTYRYLIDNGNEDKKAKGTKKHVIKRNLKLKNYKNCLEVTQLNNKIKYLEKR